LIKLRGILFLEQSLFSRMIVLGVVFNSNYI